MKFIGSNVFCFLRYLITKPCFSKRDYFYIHLEQTKSVDYEQDPITMSRYLIIQNGAVRKASTVWIKHTNEEFKYISIVICFELFLQQKKENK